MLKAQLRILSGHLYTSRTSLSPKCEIREGKTVINRYLGLLCPRKGGVDYEPHFR